MSVYKDSTNSLRIPAAHMCEYRAVRAWRLRWCPQPGSIARMADGAGAATE